MKLIDRAIEGKYWIVYYLVYVISIGICVSIYQVEIFGADVQKNDRLFLLAAIVGLSAGIAVLAVILVEVTVRMVLLIPSAWRKAKGEGREEERSRVKSIIAQHGKRDPTTGALTISAEGVSLLNDPDQPSQ